MNVRIKLIYALLVCIAFPFVMNGKHKTYNLGGNSCLNGVSVTDVLNKSHYIGEWNISSIIKKYKDDKNELYILQEDPDYKPDAGFVISADQLESFIKCLGRAKEVMEKSQDENCNDYKDVERYDGIGPTWGRYEYVSVDKNGNSYEYGCVMQNIVFFNDKFLPSIVMYLYLEKAPRFPYNTIHDGKYSIISFNSAKEISALIGVLQASMENENSSMNPDTIHRLGSYTNKASVKSQCEIFQYGSGPSSKYYINIGRDLSGNDFYDNYLWLKSENLPAFKAWLNDIYNEYKEACESLPTDKSKKFKLSENVILEGIITGRIDAEMKVIEGFKIDNDAVYADIDYSEQDKCYRLWIWYYKYKYFMLFSSPEEFKNFIDALVM